MKRNRQFLLMWLMIAGFAACDHSKTSAPAVTAKPDHAVQITFVELGSVNCVPCKAMQPVMKAIGERYGGQIKIVFYDVWKADQKKYAQQYQIRLIPTQLFFDAAGREIFRHEGFLPEADIDRLLQSHGLKPAAAGEKS